MALGDLTDPYLAKQGDTLPIIQRQPKQGTPPKVIPMTGATAVFSMRQAPLNAQGAPQPGAVVVNRGTATIIDEANGVVQWAAPSGAWTANTGMHQAEFEVTFAGGGKLTFPPGDKFIYILVGDDIA